MPWKSYKEASREDWGCEESLLGISERLKLGALLRIADSLERMEKPYFRLLGDLKYYKKLNKELMAENEKLARFNTGLRGYITRLKKK